MARFAARFDPAWRLPMLVVGAKPSNSYVEIEDGHLGIHFGFFHDRIPLADVAGAERRTWRFIDGLGVRFDSETMAYIASSADAVRIRLHAKRRFPGPFWLKISRASATVALEDPDGFIAALTQRLQAAPDAADSAGAA